MLESKVEVSPKRAVIDKYLKINSSKINLTISKEQFENLVGMVVHSGLSLFFIFRLAIQEHAWCNRVHFAC